MGKEVNKSFVFFESWYDVLETEKSEVQWEVIHAIMEYVFRGNLVELKPQAGMAFKFIKRDIDRNLEKYEEKVEKLRENSKKGGNPNFKKGQPNPYYENNQTLPDITYNVNVDVNEDVDVCNMSAEQIQKFLLSKTISIETWALKSKIPQEQVKAKIQEFAQQKERWEENKWKNNSDLIKNFEFWLMKKREIEQRNEPPKRKRNEF